MIATRLALTLWGTVPDADPDRPREVILYFRALPPKAEKDIDLDLLAAVPGTYTAPATSAYLYYTDEDKSWAAPLEITVSK